MKLKICNKYGDWVIMPYQSWSELRRAVITAKIYGYKYEKAAQ